MTCGGVALPVLARIFGISSLSLVEPKIYRKAVYPKVNRNASFSSGTILDRIVETKHAEVAELRREARGIRAAGAAAPTPPDFRGALVSGSAVAGFAEV